MDKIMIEARKRKAGGKQAAKLRAAGKVPGVMYGHGVQPESLELDSRELERVYDRAGGNKIVGLKVGDGAVTNVLIYDVQREPMRGRLTHADFYLVRMDEELRAEVPIHYVGESTAVYQDEGTLVKNLEAIEVECLPDRLPENFEVDISVLDDFEKTITVGDLKVPEGVKLMIEDLDTLVAKVDPPRSDEELAELEEAVAEALPEGVEEGEAAAGEAAEEDKK
ncbi:MAG TPA: 50S ribosomal protein L25 [Candidatus Saccharimonas sp.]|nr:50S ribosomal protein L25 [Candidatus Saccharimonas sp.]